VTLRSSVARAALISLLVLPASAAGQAPAPAPAPAPADPAVKPIVEPLPDVVARVNGEAISKGDLEEAMTQVQARAGQPIPADQRDKIVRAILDQLISFRLLRQESTSRNVAVPDSDLEARITEIKSQFKSDEAFTQVLAEQKLTPETLRANLREGMQIDQMIDAEVNARAAVTPEQVEAFYTGNPGEFQRAERIRASHILVRIAPDADAATKEQARTKVADLLTQVRAGGDFAALAKQHSDDPGSGPGGGDLGFFERGQMVGPFEEAAFGLMPGQTSEVIETQFGLHIIRLEEKQAAGAVPLSEVRPQIEEFLQGRNREEQAKMFIDALRAKGKIEIFI
jgi:peptidyl-prolyl cis-trans isomerase C